MKIALIGAHGTFKTTLIYFLAGVLKAKGKNVGIIREVTRACPYFKTSHGNILAQNWILLTQAQWEREFMDKYDYVLCDRSLIDNYIYTKEAYEKEGQDLPGWIEPFVLHHEQTYNFLFKTPISPFGLINDGVRSTNLEWQQEIEQKLKSFLREQDIKYIELPRSEGEHFDDIIEYATRQAKFMANKIIDMDVQTRL
ncbi:MAG: ATP-binding protein [Nanoarchaeota archaeon]|nr:ATP-binding protein [Nanoarchaeota archaeon]